VKEKKLLQHEEICENIEATWKELKYGNGKDHYYARHIVATTVVSARSSSSKQVAMNCVGLNFRSVLAQEHRRLLSNQLEGTKWVKSDRKQWSDAIIENVKQIVLKWWTEETRVSPNAKDVVRHLITANNWERHATHFLQESQVVLSATQVLFCTFFFFVSILLQTLFFMLCTLSSNPDLFLLVL